MRNQVKRHSAALAAFLSLAYCGGTAHGQYAWDGPDGFDADALDYQSEFAEKWFAPQEWYGDQVHDSDQLYDDEPYRDAYNPYGLNELYDYQPAPWRPEVGQLPPDPYYRYPVLPDALVLPPQSPDLDLYTDDWWDDEGIYNDWY